MGRRAGAGSSRLIYLSWWSRSKREAIMKQLIRPLAIRISGPADSKTASQDGWMRPEFGSIGWVAYNMGSWQVIGGLFGRCRGGSVAESSRSHEELRQHQAPKASASGATPHESGLSNGGEVRPPLRLRGHPRVAAIAGIADVYYILQKEISTKYQ